MTPTRFARAVLPAVLLCLVAGCSMVPVGGPVFSGQAVEPEDPLENPYIRIIPAPPQDGWSPEEIVRGFLAASASFEDRHAVARQYLAPQARSQWGPDRQVTVYDDGGDSTLAYSYTADSTAEVALEAPELATIDAQGQYVAAAQDERVDTTFQLRIVDGEWRITQPPDGLLLTRRDVSRAYRVLNLYYFEPEHRTLVPDPVFVPVQARANLATALVRALLRGPTDWLGPAVRTAFTPDAELLDEVTLTAGTVTVNLDPVDVQSDEALARMSAQLVWTVKQLPDMQQLRLQIDGETVDVPGASGDEELQSRNSWGRYGPDSTGGDLSGYFVRDGALWMLTDDGPQRAIGAVGTGQVPLEDPAVSLDGRRIAALGPAGEVYIGELHKGGGVQQAFANRRFTALSWDRYGNLWAAEESAEGSRIWMLRKDGQPVQVDAPKLESTPVLALRVARDGSRVAAVAGRGETSALLLGRVVRDGGTVRAESFLPLATDLEQVTDVAWRGADVLAVLGRGNRGAVLPYLVDVDGTRVSPTGSVGDMESIAAAPGSDMLAGISGGEVWRSRDELSWQVVDEGTDPVYPG